MPTNPLFENVYQADSLGFFADQILNPKRVVDFLNLETEDVAKIAGIAKASVRWDEKIPQELRIRLEAIANICLLVADHFKGDAVRTAVWFKTKNPMLGDITPRDMVRFGRHEKLLKFVLAAHELNAESSKKTEASR